jgi:hypothetical protein
MRQVAYPAALGCGYLLGTGGSQAMAAEWSITPSYSSSFDYDSNRRLLRDSKGTESGVLSADLRFKRALEDGDIFIEPRYALRRFSDKTLGNGDDRSLAGGFDWNLERSILNFNASIWDQSTLLTEQLQTGIITGNTHRLTKQAATNLTWSQTELRQLVAQLSYQDVSYSGQASNLLVGYRYPSGSVGERFNVLERGSITFSAFGSSLLSSTRGNSSREYGLQTEVLYDFSERTQFDASIGESSRQLAGQNGHGTDAAVSLTHTSERTKSALNYTRSLVPYGIGFLVERQQFTLSETGHLTERLDATVSLLRVENNQLAVLLGLDRRSYDSAAVNLNWFAGETWSVGMQVSAIRTQAPGTASGTVNDWHGSFSLVWSPRPLARSW